MTKSIHRAVTVVVLTAVIACAVIVMPVVPADAATSAMQVVNLTNAQRTRHGCRRLTVNARLVRAAALHSKDMAARGYLSHTSLNGRTFVDRARNAGYRYAIGENIAWGYRTPKNVMAGWMKSSGHRANILNCRARSVGVAVAANRKGVRYWTQMFGRV